MQIGLWLTTRHCASRPHAPGHGSWHFMLTQALDGGHSELEIHSGRQSGGTPSKPDWQEQTGWEPTGLQTLFGPHGEGSQGLTTDGSVGRTTVHTKGKKKTFCLNFDRGFARVWLYGVNISIVHLFPATRIINFMTYRLGWVDRTSRDPRWILVDRHRLVGGLRHGNQRWSHKSQDKDRRTFGWHKLGCLGNHCSQHTQVGNWVPFQSYWPYNHR